MLQIALFLLGYSICIFAWIMIHDPRTLWSGVSFFWMMVCLAVFLLFFFTWYADLLVSHDVLTGILVISALLAFGCVIAFPGVLIMMFFIEGIRVIRHEGMKPANLLSVLFSLLLFGYLAVWPAIGNLTRNTAGTMFYVIISFAALYLLSLMAMYALSAILNLLHLRKRRRADYIVVLGAGIIGKRVTPLLAARIDRGIQLLRRNPKALLIMSGGQGPGEDIPEGEAMAAYAVSKGVEAERILIENRSVSTEENLRFSRELMRKERPRIVIVTTAYHVFRALILARKQGIRCVGFGAKTKWYFTLNALIREFIGYLWLTRKRHVSVIAVAAVLVMLVNLISIVGYF